MQGVSKDSIYAEGSKVKSNTRIVLAALCLKRKRFTLVDFGYRRYVYTSDTTITDHAVEWQVSKTDIFPNNSKLELMLTWGLNPIARALSSKVMGRVLKLCAGLSCESPCSPHLRQEKINGSN
jgi:hypothetical protein